MNTKFLEEIEDWKLEAKLEDTERYFYHTRIVNRILKGQKLYLIGRKGTGKTAISEYLNSIKEHDYFSQKLTFKNFPFNKLYDLDDKGFNTPNQYITLWKYVIYSTVCQLMIKNEAIDLETRNKLEKLFNDDIKSALASAVERWTGFRFDVKILGSGFGVGGNKESINDTENWIDRVTILENFILQHIQKEKYIIMFDELDEDYKDMLEREKNLQYTQLLTSLFKAVQDIRAKFQEYNFFPIIFLRDDIYDILQDPDKTKWIDYKADLEWNESSIKQMLAFRLSKALNKNGDIESFDIVWKKLFDRGDVKYGNQQLKRIPPFQYITRSSLLRPRDYIRYLQVCSEKALEKDMIKIKPSLVNEADMTFSNYLRSELEDEIHSILPDIHEILNIFTTIRKQTLKISEFETTFQIAYKQGLIKTDDSQLVLQILFHFSLIGNQPRQSSHQIFRYKNKDARLNMRENIIVHRGLFRSLQIL